MPIGCVQIQWSMSRTRLGKKIHRCQHQDSVVDSPQVSPQCKQVHTVLQPPIETVYSHMKATARSLVTTSRSTTLYR